MKYRNIKNIFRTSAIKILIIRHCHKEYCTFLIYVYNVYYYILIITNLYTYYLIIIYNLLIYLLYTNSVNSFRTCA